MTFRLRRAWLFIALGLAAGLASCCLCSGQGPTANLLKNASFESSSAGWRANNLAGSVNLQQYNPGVGPGYAHDGSGYLEMNTSQAGGSVAQDISIPPQQGQSYTFSVWLRASPSATSQISGTVTLWGLGGTQENGGTNFTVGQAWTLVTAPLDVQNSGHSALRAEIYMDTTGQNLDADGAKLLNVNLANASFESSSAGWGANNFAGSVSLQQYNPGPYGAGYAHDGSGFFEMSTTQAGGSVSQNVSESTQPGQSYSFSVWLRAAPGAPAPISGTVALWGLGGTQESGSTNFTVGQAWTLVSAPLDVLNSGHNTLRTEIYLNTKGQNLDIDGAELVDAGLKNASFESSSAGWHANNLASKVNLQQYNPGVGPGYAHDGSGYLEMNSSQAGGSVAQDISISPQQGQSYTFAVWLRASPSASSEISGTVALWGLGGTQESSSTNFAVGQTWTLVTAPLDVQNSGHNTLRAEVYMNTTGRNLDADGAVIPFLCSNCQLAPPPPICDTATDSCAFSDMPLYDQTNPNFAFVTVPASIWQQESQPNASPPLSPVSNSLQAGTACAVLNPYYTSWLPLGPMSGDPGALAPGDGCYGWSFTDLCGPSAESMALVAAAGYKGVKTTVSGWTQNFLSAIAPSGQVGFIPNPSILPVLPAPTVPSSFAVTGTPNRAVMNGADVQRVINMAVAQGTLPNSGGQMDQILSTANDFSPSATGSSGNASAISNATFTSALESGFVIVFCIHDYTAHLTTSGLTTTVSFTSNGGGHILAVNGEQSGTLVVYDPVYAQEEMLNMSSISAGTFTQVLGRIRDTRIIQAPESGLNTVAVWPESGVSTAPFDLVDGQVITFIDGYLQYKVN